MPTIQHKIFYNEVAAYKAKEKTVKFQAIETVKDNMKGYTQQQITAAKKSQRSLQTFAMSWV